MNDVYFYRAFGMTIRSEFPIAQLPAAEDGLCDVSIESQNLSVLKMLENHIYTTEKDIYFYVPDLARFRICDGQRIEVDPFPACQVSHLGVYLMGSCMGAVLHQRGFMPLHGSCVTDGCHAILITGDSGAGKSTLAAEFLSKGWKLITDDVTAVYNAETVPMVQASYPSQKLWQDSMDRYECEESSIHSLYFDDTREKFGIDVSGHFSDTTCPLSMVVRLIPTDAPCQIGSIEWMPAINQFMNNTYRLCMVAPGNRQRHFQRCVTLAQKVPMVLLTRQIGIQCADQLYKMITTYVGEMKHE